MTFLERNLRSRLRIQKVSILFHGGRNVALLSSKSACIFQSNFLSKTSLYVLESLEHFFLINFSQTEFSCQLWSSFERRQHAEVKCCDFSEKCAVSICRFTEFFKVHAEAIWGRICVGLIKQSEGVCPITDNRFLRNVVISNLLC